MRCKTDRTAPGFKSIKCKIIVKGEVIQGYGTNRKLLCDFLLLTVALYRTVWEIRRLMS